MKQFLNFGNRSSDTSNSVIPSSRLILTTSFSDHILEYNDENPASGYYSNIYYDSIKTQDSTYSYTFENELAWKKNDNGERGGLKDLIGIGFSVKHQFIKVHQREIDTTFNNAIAGAELFNTYSKNKFWWNLSADYALNGYNKNDYKAAIVLKKTFTDSLNVLTLYGNTRSQEADFIYNHYSSNHFKWNNDFDKMQQLDAGIFFTMKKYRLGVSLNISNYSNILYFDNYAIARQLKSFVQIVSASLRKDFTLYNWHLNNKVNYQHVPDSTVIRLPEFVLEHSLYYENDLFKKVMKLQIGVSVFYNSAYYANIYMPATSEFYLQSDKKYGNYPFLDFFINAQVKTVRIFLKIDHLNGGLMDNIYMITPHYPYADRSFKFGFSWRFFD